MTSRIAAAVALAIGGAATAGLIPGSQIKDGTVTGQQTKKHSVGLNEPSERPATARRGRAKVMDPARPVTPNAPSGLGRAR